MSDKLQYLKFYKTFIKNLKNDPFTEGTDVERATVVAKETLNELTKREIDPFTTAFRIAEVITDYQERQTQDFTNLQEKIKKVNISQLAKISGVSRNNIYKILEGTSPTFKTYEKLERGLKELDDLLKECETGENNENK